MLSEAELIAFEKDVADHFQAGRIRAPVHLSGGNEKQLIALFEKIRPADWVFTAWRSHYHCLLKGVPRETLMADILAGRSITLNYPEHRIVSSAIVAGAAPQALGVAWSNKRQGSDSVVWLFMGDMSFCAGLAYEVRQYAVGHRLPLKIIVENNELSVATPTAEVWPRYVGVATDADTATVGVYEYRSKWPHQGTGQRVEF